MSIEELLQQAEEVRSGDHLVALYDEEKEIEEYTIAFIHSVLSQNERCIYITGNMDASVVLQKVKELSEKRKHYGDLIIMDRTEIYSNGGKFSPDKLISLIIEKAKESLIDGFNGLAITGEISWVLDYEDGEELIIEYEWKLNEFVFEQYPVIALCRYNIERFSDEMIKNIIQLHPLILWKSRIHENPYYIPPEGFKGNAIAQYQVETWLKNIFRFSDEKSRFQTLVEKKQEEMSQLHQNMTNGIIMAFLNLLETHDPYTKNHCTNVADLALKLSQHLGMSEEFNSKIYYAALVHDIGKTIIPKEILNKPDRLTEDEYDEIKKHPVFGAQALEQMNQLEDISVAIRYHHEFVNGKGYPEGLLGTNIPLMSRIISICDSYDAITNHRPYRRAKTHEKAIEEIVSCKGQQFDEELVNIFIEMF